MNSATLDTGTDTSCFSALPCARSATAMFSRIFHTIAFCASEPQITASATISRPIASASRLSIMSRAPSSRGSDSSTSTRHGKPDGSGSRVSGMCLSTSCSPSCGTISKPVTAPPLAALASCNSSTAFVGDATVTHAVSFTAGRGNSFSVAAVTTPSVPSAPMKRCLRS